MNNKAKSLALSSFAVIFLVVLSLSLSLTEARPSPQTAYASGLGLSVFGISTEGIRLIPQAATCHGGPPNYACTPATAGYTSCKDGSGTIFACLWTCTCTPAGCSWESSQCSQVMCSTTKQC